MTNKMRKEITMKLFISTYTLALICTVTSKPISDSTTAVTGSGATVSVDAKSDFNSTIPSTSIDEEKVIENSAMKSSTPVPSTTSAGDDKSSLMDESKLAASKKSSPSSPLDGIEQSGKLIEPSPVNITPDIVKPDSQAKSEVPAATSSNKIEQASVSSDSPKESNNQVNAVSVNEPNLVQNEVKSEISKQETTSELLKEQVTASTSEESKESKEIQKPDASPLSSVASSENKNPGKDEQRKKFTSSEEKIEVTSLENQKEVINATPLPTSKAAAPAPTAQADEKKAPAKITKVENVNLEKLQADVTEEESLLKLSVTTESQSPTETVQPKLSTLFASSLSPLPFASPVQESVKDTHEEKKSTETFVKKDKIKSTSNKNISEEEIKSTKSE